MEIKGTLKPVVNRTLSLLEERGRRATPSLGINTGYAKLDELLGGFQNATLNIVASRPSMGKSAFVETMMLNMAVKDSLSIMFFSIEATAEIIGQRFLANKSDITLRELQSGRLSPEKWKHLENEIHGLEKANISIDTTANIDIDELCKLARKQCSEEAIDTIFIDFIQLITTTNTRTIANREQEIGYIARVLKGLAKELDIPIFVTSQLNRRYTEKGTESSREPVLADLRDSGTLEDVADSVIFIHRPEVFGICMDEDGESLSGMAYIIIAKNRHGSTDRIKIIFRKELCRFEDLADNSESCNIIREFDNSWNKNDSPF